MTTTEELLKEKWDRYFELCGKKEHEKHLKMDNEPCPKCMSMAEMYIIVRARRLGYEEGIEAARENPID